jgi:hypothetical protein
MVSEGNGRYDVQVDWSTVTPLGDTLSIRAQDGFDDRWVEAFEVVLDEHERQVVDRKWTGIDFEYASGEPDRRFVLLVRGIEPDARSFEVRRTVDDVVEAANTVARVGTHVYELARELRRPEPGAERGSVPPPLDPLADELDADAA